ncbi:MAG TPA: hypothetical protein VK972_06305 [Wenzhouxiangella sp.]|nr:hypothetical protein [Wenzhouxiangella sp.]
MAKRIEWTEQRKARLRQLLVDEGLTYREAARRMGLRYNQVKQAALTHRLGNHAPRYPWREWDRAEYDTLERLLEQGNTYPQIAAAMSLTLNQVKGAAQRLGMMRQERLGMHRVRADWPEIDRITRDCIEADLMTIPQTHRHLAALGYRLGLSTLYKRVSDIDDKLRARAEANAKRRKVAVGQRIQRARAAKRQQEAA